MALYALKNPQMKPLAVSLCLFDNTSSHPVFSKEKTQKKYFFL